MSAGSTDPEESVTIAVVSFETVRVREIFITGIHDIPHVIYISGVASVSHRRKRGLHPVFLAQVSDEPIFVSHFAQVAAIGSVNLIVVEPADFQTVICKEPVISPIAEALTIPCPKPVHFRTLAQLRLDSNNISSFML